MNKEEQDTQGMGTVDGCRKIGIVLKTEEEPEPYLNRAARRKHGLKGINVPKTHADEVKEYEVIQKLKKEGKE